jgi:hypothetical protein
MLIAALILSDGFDGHRAGVAPAQRDLHPPDHDRQRIAATKHAAMGNRHPRAFGNAQCAQALAFVFSQHGPVHRRDAGTLAKGETIKRHRLIAARSPR